MATSTNKVIRITKAQRFEDIKALLTGGDIKFDTTIDIALEVIDHELDLLSRKNSSTSKKVAETRQANAKRKDEIVEYLTTLDEDSPGLTCTEIIKGLGWGIEDCSTSRMSRLLRDLKEEGMVTNQAVKGKSLFKLA